MPFIHVSLQNYQNDWCASPLPGHPQKQKSQKQNPFFEFLLLTFTAFAKAPAAD